MIYIIYILLVMVSTILFTIVEVKCYGVVSKIDKLEKQINELNSKTEKKVYAVWILKDKNGGVCSNCFRYDKIDNIATHCRYCGARIK